MTLNDYQSLAQRTSNNALPSNKLDESDPERGDKEIGVFPECGIACEIAWTDTDADIAAARKEQP